MCEQYVSCMYRQISPKAGAEVDEGGGIFGSPLHVAAVHTDVEIAGMLIS